MTVQDDPVMALRIQLHQFPCPTCGTHERRPRLQCDYYPDGCLWLVRCNACQAQYHLDHRDCTHVGERPEGCHSRRTCVHPERLTEQKGGSHANP